MSDYLSDKEVDALLSIFHVDAYGGDWKKHLPKDHKDYDPNAEFDQEAEDDKWESTRIWADFFARDEVGRLRWEWADFCQGCIYCDRLPKRDNVFKCKKSGAVMSLAQIRERKKPLDCPIGFDKTKYLEKREQELKIQAFQEYRERVEEMLMDIGKEEGYPALIEFLEGVKVKAKENQKK